MENLIRTSINPETKSFKNGVAVVYDASLLTEVSPSLFSTEYYGSSINAVKEGGRSAAWFVNSSAGKAVLRQYRRGGLVARLIKQKYLWLGASRTRSFAEFKVLSKLYKDGVSVPKPIAAMYKRKAVFYSAAIMVQCIENSITLGAVIKSESSPSPDIVNSVADVISSMHNAGVWHADLNVHNILLDETNKAWLIDFDKARLCAVTNSQRTQNLDRLQRSIYKVAPSNAGVWAKAIKQEYYS